MKYIFIDTNQYRHLFSKNEGFSDQIKNLLDKLITKKHVKLLLPQQVRDETERNRFESWYNQEIKACESRIENLNGKIIEYEKSLTKFPKEFKNIEKILKKEIKQEEKEFKNIKKRYRNLKSKPNQKLKSIFHRAEYIEENAEIINRARLRLEKRNPPNNNNKLGDVLIWESILDYIPKSDSGSTLIFVAGDKNAWGDNGFNPWLARELKAKTNVIITLTKALSDINELTKEDQENLRKVELHESKNNAVLNFIHSQSFISAGTNIDKLLKYKNILTKDDYIKIINASISNLEIYQSFFTSNGLNYLCAKENGYVVSVLEDIHPVKWKKFVEMNGINSKRQTDEKEKEELNSNDIPF